MMTEQPYAIELAKNIVPPKNHPWHAILHNAATELVRLYEENQRLKVNAEALTTEARKHANAVGDNPNMRIQYLIDQATHMVTSYASGIDDSYRELNGKMLVKLVATMCGHLVKDQQYRVMANAEYKRGHADACDDGQAVICTYFGIKQ